MFYVFDPVYLLYLAPALLLAFWAQFRVKSAYAEAQQVPAPMTGAEAARRVLDAAGLYNVEI
ncbi:MAG TPA: zinc metallopeptidase [Pirellulales bacterium]|nr:zinc metallopeptidase [Pirellulales bacterium]